MSESRFFSLSVSSLKSPLDPAFVMTSEQVCGFYTQLLKGTVQTLGLVFDTDALWAAACASRQLPGQLAICSPCEGACVWQVFWVRGRRTGTVCIFSSFTGNSTRPSWAWEPSSPLNLLMSSSSAAAWLGIAPHLKKKTLWRSHVSCLRATPNVR